MTLANERSYTDIALPAMEKKKKKSTGLGAHLENERNGVRSKRNIPLDLVDDAASVQSFSTTRQRNKHVKEFTRMIEKLTKKLEDKEKQVEELQSKLDEATEESAIKQRTDKATESVRRENEGLRGEVTELEEKLQAREKELTAFHLDSLERSWEGDHEGKLEDSELERRLKEAFVERDRALKRAGTLAQDLAESRAREDDLAERLAHTEKMLRAQRAKAEEEAGRSFWKRSAWSTSKRTLSHDDDDASVVSASPMDDLKSRMFFRKSSS